MGIIIKGKEEFIRIYPFTDNADLAKKYNIKKRTVESRAYEWGLRKDRDDISWKLTKDQKKEINVSMYLYSGNESYLLERKKRLACEIRDIAKWKGVI